jgi:hypothetical protein
MVILIINNSMNEQEGVSSSIVEIRGLSMLRLPKLRGVSRVGFAVSWLRDDI